MNLEDYKNKDLQKPVFKMFSKHIYKPKNGTVKLVVDGVVQRIAVFNEINHVGMEVNMVVSHADGVYFDSRMNIAEGSTVVVEFEPEPDKTHLTKQNRVVRRKR